MTGPTAHTNPDSPPTRSAPGERVLIIEPGRTEKNYWSDLWAYRELFLHRQAIEQVRRALETLADLGDQVFYATHSPIMISRRATPLTRIGCNDAQRGDTKAVASLDDALSRRVSDEDYRLYVRLDLRSASGCLFSYRVLSSEGNIEQALLRQSYGTATGQTLAVDRMALVILGSVSVVPAAIEVFTVLGIAACALVYSNCALTQVVKLGLVVEQEPDLQCCLGQLAAMAAKDATIKLKDKGRPTNNGNKNAAHVYREWGQGTAVRPTAQALHDKLKPHRIWLWPGGDIKHDLGLSGLQAARSLGRLPARSRTTAFRDPARGSCHRPVLHRLAPDSARRNRSRPVDCRIRLRITGSVLSRFSDQPIH